MGHPGAQLPEVVQGAGRPKAPGSSGEPPRRFLQHHERRRIQVDSASAAGYELTVIVQTYVECWSELTTTKYIPGQTQMPRGI